MLTIFSTPKPFEGHIDVIQRNAITSWTFLKPRPEIILFGNDKGIKEICAELKLIHIPVIGSNEYGTPLVSELFKQAESSATNDLMCYVNADIILLTDFMELTKRLDFLGNKIVAVAHRWDVDVKEFIDFSVSGWEKKFKQSVIEKGDLQEGGWDYIVYPKELYENILPFSIGRGYWDAWLGLEARRLGAMLLNTTNLAMAIHQNHGYFKSQNTDSPEQQQNWKLIGGWRYIFQRSTATHIIKDNKIVPEPFWEYYIHIYYRLTSFLMQRTYNIRRKLGLYKWWKRKAV
jgi:hypothetical protein